MISVQEAQTHSNPQTMHSGLCLPPNTQSEPPRGESGNLGLNCNSIPQLSLPWLPTSSDSQLLICKTGKETRTFKAS